MLEVKSQWTVWNDSKQSNENPGTVHGAGFDCRTGRVYAFEGASTDGMWNKVSQNINFLCCDTEGVPIKKGGLYFRKGGEVMIVSVQFYLFIICTFTSSLYAALFVYYLQIFPLVVSVQS